MFNSKDITKEISPKSVMVDGVMMRPSWKDTLLSMKPGEERTFPRQLLTTGQARVAVSRINTTHGTHMNFSVRTVGNDDAVTIIRNK